MESNEPKINLNEVQMKEIRSIEDGTKIEVAEAGGSAWPDNEHAVQRAYVRAHAMHDPGPRVTPHAVHA